MVSPVGSADTGTGYGGGRGRGAVAAAVGYDGGVAEDQVEQAERHGHGRAGPRANADHRRSRTQADFWNPTGYYLNIVEFDSREAAMDNSARAEVGEFAAQLAQLCDSPLRFYNLDVREVWQPSASA